MTYPPEYGPLAAVTPGTPGGLLVMLAEYGKLSLEDVLAPAMQMADGYPIEAELADTIERQRRRGSRNGRTRRRSSCRIPASKRERRSAGEIFRQPDLARDAAKLVDAEQQALQAGKSRKDAILAAYDRFYKGDIAQEFVRGSQEQGGLHTRRGPRELEGASSRSRSRRRTRASTSTSSTSGRRAPRCCRR